ncbi:MAG: hypothetical protein DMD65_06580 [Gemmatimonadetes bacterium]|nr:MAG: hypothetical protein DMD65_06580 [Gemmatimonadota bacterium]
MPLLTGIFLFLALVLGGFAAYLQSEAWARLSRRGDKHPWVVYFLSWLAPQADFTPDGWRLHRRAITCGLLASFFLILTFASTKW